MRLGDLDALSKKMFYVEEKQGGYGWVVALEDITKAPTIDPEDLRPKGRWVVSGCGFDTCSECRKVYSDGWFSMSGYKPRMKFKYCPNCGADMRGKEHG